MARRSAPATDAHHGLPRLPPAVFWALALWMVGLGLVTGLAFPPMVVLLGVSRHDAFTWTFYAATVSAGLMVGGVNYALSRAVVGHSLRHLAQRMRSIAATVHRTTHTGDWAPDTAH